MKVWRFKGSPSPSLTPKDWLGKVTKIEIQWFGVCIKGSNTQQQLTVWRICPICYRNHRNWCWTSPILGVTSSLTINKMCLGTVLWGQNTCHGYPSPTGTVVHGVYKPLQTNTWEPLAIYCHTGVNIWQDTDHINIKTGKVLYKSHCRKGLTIYRNTPMAGWLFAHLGAKEHRTFKKKDRRLWDQ